MNASARRMSGIIMSRSTTQTRMLTYQPPRSRISKNANERETLDETPGRVLQRLFGSDVGVARACRGRGARHDGNSLGQECVQFRRDAVRPAALAEFEPPPRRHR